MLGKAIHKAPLEEILNSTEENNIHVPFACELHNKISPIIADMPYEQHTRNNPNPSLFSILGMLVVWAAGNAAYDGTGGNREFNIEQLVTHNLITFLQHVHGPTISRKLI